MKTAEIFKALSDGTRIRILNLLLKGELCVCDIEVILKLSQTNVSRHLAKLKYAGILDMRKELTWVYYNIKDEFILNNGSLIEYLKNILDADDICKLDDMKFKNYKEKGGNCRKYENDRNIV